MTQEKQLPRVKPWCSSYPADRPPRLLRPFLLLLLRQREGHGYELIERMRRMGFEYSVQDAGYVYRTLRLMEAKGLITSKWNTDGPGPAKRVYAITPLGIGVLRDWARTLENLKTSLEAFLEAYELLGEETGECEPC